MSSVDLLRPDRGEVADSRDRPAVPPPPRVWVRRCGACDRDDLRASFGQPALIDERPWSCPACGGTVWAAAVDLPAPSDPGNCPHLRDGAP